MHPTENSLPATARKKVVALLTPLLADTADLRSQTKQAHWNVRGPNFQPLHELFDSIAGKLDEMTDELAERILQLGGEAPGSSRLVARQTRLDEYPYLIANGEKHVAALVEVLSHVSGSFRAGIELAEEAGDAVTADILTGMTTELDKQLWFLEAHQPVEKVSGLKQIRG